MPSAGLSRRTLLLAAAATAVAACSSRTDLQSAAAGAGSPDGDPNGDPSGNPSGDQGVNGEINPILKSSRPRSVVMVGDSITQGSKDALHSVLEDIGFTDIVINAERSRRIEAGYKTPMPGLDVVKYIANSGPPDIWVIALGTNDAGLYSNDTEYQRLIDDLLAPIGDSVPLVWIDTFREDHIDGCKQFNDVLRSTLDSRGNATVGDWFKLCSADDQQLLSGDGVHPNDDGVLVFADMVRGAVAEQIG